MERRARDVTKNQERILKLCDIVRENGSWTTDGVIGEIVYGPGNGAQTVGNTMRAYGTAESAHRVLLAGGRVSLHWRGAGGGPEEAIRRLQREGIWDEATNHAREDGFIGAARLQQLEAP